MANIKSISYRKILNSHVEFTNEFIIELDDGSWGVGSSPQGETISIYEDKSFKIEPETIIETIKREHYFDITLSQEKFDLYLQEEFPIFGRNNSYALSLAYFNATNESQTAFQSLDKKDTRLVVPSICLNVLNGGNYAYTNAVLSDFPEYLLVSRNNDLEEIIKDHNKIQNKIKEKLVNQSKTVVNNNLVSKFSKDHNRACIEFLLNILDDLNLARNYDLMIDASAGDLWTRQGYRFTLTDNSSKSSDELYLYWKSIIKDYNVKFIEDPFHEKDYRSWKKITTAQNQCNIIGDNLYSSDPQRIKEGATKKYTNGIVVKPNQAGTVSSVIRAIETAQSNNQIVITSHRSISTETSTFLAILTCKCRVMYIKIGPLCTDYSSVLRLNEIIRLTGGN